MQQIEFTSQSLFLIWLNEQTSFFSLPSPPVNSLEKSKNIENSPSSNTTSVCGSEEAHSTPIPEKAQRLQARNAKKSGMPKIGEQDRNRDFKDPCFNPKKQKKNRNVLSNLVHHLLKYLSDAEMVDEELQGIIRFHKLNITPAEIFSTLEYFDDHLKSYVTEKNIRNVLGGNSLGTDLGEEKVRDFSKVIRVLSFKFYREGCIPSIIYSNKLSYESKNLHFQGLKDIIQILESLCAPESEPEEARVKAKTMKGKK